MSMQDRIQELALDAMEPLVGKKVVGLISSPDGFTGLRFAGGQVLWIEQDTEGNVPGFPRVEHMDDLKPVTTDPPAWMPGDIVGALRQVDSMGGCSLAQLARVLRQPKNIVEITIKMACWRKQATMSPTGRSIRLTDAGRVAIS